MFCLLQKIPRKWLNRSFSCINHLMCLCLGHADDFTTAGGRVSQYAASFGNSWKVPDQQNKVRHEILNKCLFVSSASEIHS